MRLFIIHFFSDPRTILSKQKEFDARTGSNICKYLKNYAGVECPVSEEINDDCERCSERIPCSTGYYSAEVTALGASKLECTSCECWKPGIIDEEGSCDADGQCFCNSNHEGKKCNKCKDQNVATLQLCNSGECRDGFYR